jgi:hypothetical protein
MAKTGFTPATGPITMMAVVAIAATRIDVFLLFVAFIFLSLEQSLPY